MVYFDHMWLESEPSSCYLSMYCIIIAIDGAESWTLRQADKRQLDTFEMRCLRVILSVSLMDKIRNEEFQAEASSSYHHLWWSIQKALEMVRTCSPHRMPPHRLPFQAYKNDFLKRSPPAHWRDQIERDMGVPLKEAEHQAQGRPEWRRITSRRAKGHTIQCSLVIINQVMNWICELVGLGFNEGINLIVMCARR